jgi:D-serine deaminase-like pyridoxal phosphate-dependent protein
MPTQTPTDLKPELGTPKHEVETPAVIVDFDRMEANVEKYAAAAREHDVRLRSHVKTHKIPDIAHYQNDASDGGGIVCQTLSEAEVMAQNGIDDIYLSYMVVSDPKLERLMWLSEKLDSFASTVDGPGNIDPAQAAAERAGITHDVILEIDPGMRRVGVDFGEPALEIARYVSDQPDLNLAGVMAFEGHVQYDPEAETEADFEARIFDILDDLEDTVDRIEADGTPIDQVKVGSTRTSLYSAKHDVVTEINPGMYPFLDVRTYRGTPHFSREDCALTIVSEVISDSVEGQVICDAGSKTISLETDTAPEAVQDPNADYFNASEEHGWVDVSDCKRTFEVGDRIEFITPHVCPSVNLHDSVVGVRDDTVVEVWSVQARGKVR